MQQRRLERHLLDATVLAGASAAPRSRAVASPSRPAALSGGPNPRRMAPGFTPASANGAGWLAGMAATNPRSKSGHANVRRTVVAVLDSPRQSGSRARRNSRPDSSVGASAGTGKRVTFGESTESATTDGLHQVRALPPERLELEAVLSLTCLLCQAARLTPGHHDLLGVCVTLDPGSEHRQMIPYIFTYRLTRPCLR